MNIQDEARDSDGCWESIVEILGVHDDIPNMSAKDRLMMSPWEKWNKYSRFPWKSIIHTLMVMIVIVQIILISTEYGDYARSSNQTFEYMFIPEEDIYTIPDFMEALNETLIRESVDQYIHPTIPGNATLMPVKMQVTRYQKSFYNRTTNEYIYSNFHDLSTTTETYYIWEGNLGPLNATGDALSSFFYSLVEIQTEFQFENLDIGVFGPVPFLWHLYVIYNFRNGGGQVDVKTWTAKEITGIGNFSTLDVFTWLNSMNLALHVASFILSLKALYENYDAYTKTRRKYNVRASIPAVTLNTKYSTLKTVSLLDYYRTWEQVPIGVKIQFYNLWNVWIGFGNVLGGTGCILGILYDHGHGYEIAYYLFLGSGAFFTICNMIRYLEYSTKFYTSILTLRMAFLRVVFCIISVAPIYFGFAFFGVLVFGQFVDLFSDLDQTSVTLFALLNGDTILDAFAELKDKFPYPIIGRLYMYLFNALFITAILNIFIFIIEDSYHNAKSWGKKAKKRKKGPPNFNIRKLFEVLEVKNRSTRRNMIGRQRDLEASSDQSPAASASYATSPRSDFFASSPSQPPASPLIDSSGDHELGDMPNDSAPPPLLTIPDSGTVSISTPMLAPAAVSYLSGPVPVQATLPVADYVDLKKQVDKLFQTQREQSLKEMEQWMVRMNQMQEQLMRRMNDALAVMENVELTGRSPGSMGDSPHIV